MARQTSIRRLLIADALTTWVPPIGALAVLVLAVLLNALDLLPGAFAAAAAVLSLLVLGACSTLGPFFDPERAPRAIPLPVLLLVTLAWVVVLYYPFHCRIFPGPMLARFALDSAAAGTRLPLADHGSQLDLVVEARLPIASGQHDRVVHYDLDLVNDGGEHAHYTGELGDRWRMRRLGRRGRAPNHLEHLSAAHTVADPTAGDLRVNQVAVSGEKGATLAATLYAHRGPGPRVLYAGAGLLTLAALVFDLWCDPRGTPTATLVTAASAAAALIFSAAAAGHVTIREVIGATVAGAIIGVPVAAVTAWLARAVVVPAVRIRR